MLKHKLSFHVTYNSTLSTRNFANKKRTLHCDSFLARLFSFFFETFPSLSRRTPFLASQAITIYKLTFFLSFSRLDDTVEENADITLREKFSRDDRATVSDAGQKEQIVPRTRVDRFAAKKLSRLEITERESTK